MGKVFGYVLLAAFAVWQANAFSFQEAWNHLTAANSEPSQANISSVNSEVYECVRDGLFPDHDNCSAYFQCSNGLANYMPCPEGFHFSTVTERCESQCDAHCDESLACTCDWPSCRRPLGRQIACTKDGLMEDPERCDFYIHCSNGNPHSMRCSKGLHFSKETEKCESPCVAKCDHSIACSCGWSACTADVCHLPTKPGLCQGHFPRWHYDKRSSTCKQFVYGGCGGNENNFETKEKCENLCDPCNQEKDAGPCHASKERYYFHKEEGKCVKFIYGGCQGNENNFRTKKQCEQKCLRRDSEESESLASNTLRQTNGCPDFTACIRYCKSIGKRYGMCVPIFSPRLECICQ